MTEHDDSFPSLMPKPGAPLLPVQIGPTSRRRHLTGMVALNIPDRWDGHGDWHMSATWFWTEPETLKPHSFTDKETYGELSDRLGTTWVRLFFVEEFLPYEPLAKLLGCGSAQSSDSQGEHPIVLDFDCVFWS